MENIYIIVVIVIIIIVYTGVAEITIDDRRPGSSDEGSRGHRKGVSEKVVGGWTKEECETVKCRWGSPPTCILNIILCTNTHLYNINPHPARDDDDKNNNNYDVNETKRKRKNRHTLTHLQIEKNYMEKKTEPTDEITTRY